jgi:transcriptional regulator with XRE-family HTH domain
MGKIPKKREPRLGPAIPARQLAVLAGVSTSHVGYILAGKRRPSLAVAGRLAKACGISLQELSDYVDAAQARAA